MKDNQSRPNPPEEKKKPAMTVDPSAKCSNSPDGKHYWREDAPCVKRCCYCGLILIP